MILIMEPLVMNDIDNETKLINFDSRAKLINFDRRAKLIAIDCD